MPNKSSVSRSQNKSAKPYPDFPLFAHGTRRWAKKIRGKHHYFGPWEDPDAALRKYLDQRDDLHAGRTPRSTSGGLTVRNLCNHFLTSKRHLLDTSELSPRTFRNGKYVETLTSGEYAFWRSVADAKIVEVDLREQTLDVAGQEIMTADKVTLRMNAVVTYRVVDAHRTVTVADGAQQSLHREAQLALRAVVATRGLDSFLTDKDVVVLPQLDFELLACARV